MKVAASKSAARLELGMALERAQDTYGALLQFARALYDEQAQDRWTNPASTPVALRPLVEHAVRSVRSGRRNYFLRSLEPVAAKYGPASLVRLHQCLRIYLQEEAAVYPDPRQRPSFLYFPGLSSTPYLKREWFS